MPQVVDLADAQIRYHAGAQIHFVGVRGHLFQVFQRAVQVVVPELDLTLMEVDFFPGQAVEAGSVVLLEAGDFL